MSDTELLLDELRDLLTEERRVLLSGKPDQITDVARRKLLLAERIDTACGSDIAPKTKTLIWLDRYNRENSIICAAMLRHLTAAIDTLRRHDLHRSYKLDGTEQNPLAQQALGAA
jgi:flagellar biosynthesis/type III secretory pathway chaperone